MHTTDLIKTNETQTKLKLCLVPIKFEGKCEGNKKRGKLKRKKKMKENKIDSKSIKYFIYFFKLILLIFPYYIKIK